MSKICKAFLIEDGSNSEYLVNSNNLSAFLYHHRDVKEVVVTGPMSNLFVLSMKKGNILYCSDDTVKTQLELEMQDFTEKAPNLFLFEVLVSVRQFDSVKIFSDSRWQALKDFSQWSLFPPLKIKLA